MDKFIVVILFLISFSTKSAETIRIGLEPFPPLINSNKSGYTINFLEKISKLMGVEFEYIIMPYSRAKNGLQKRKLDLIAHTPFENETALFYSYARELEFNILAHVDIISLTNDFSDFKSDQSRKMIGTPRGNEEFFSEIYNIPLNNFYTGELESLMLMLKKGRIKYLLFDRASLKRYSQKYIQSKVYFKYLGDLGAGFAVSNSKEGLQLKRRLDKIIKKLNTKEIFKNYLKTQSKTHSDFY